MYMTAQKRKSKGKRLSPFLAGFVTDEIKKVAQKQLETKESAYFTNGTYKIVASPATTDLIVPIPIVAAAKTGTNPNALALTNSREDQQISVIRSRMIINMSVDKGIDSTLYPNGILFDVRVFSIKGINTYQPSYINPQIAKGLAQFLVNPEHGVVGATNAPYKPIEGKFCDASLPINTDMITLYHSQTVQMMSQTAGFTGFTNTTAPSYKTIVINQIPGFQKTWKYDAQEQATGDSFYYPNNVLLFVSVTCRNPNLDGAIPVDKIGFFNVESHVYFKDA